MAEKTGGTVEDVLAGLEHEDQFDAFLAAVNERYSYIYAGAWTDDFPRSTSTVRVKGEVPGDLAELARVPPTWTSKSSVGAQYSWSELTDLATAVAGSLRVEGYAEANTAVSARENRIEVVVPQRAERGSLQAAGVRARIAERIAETLPQQAGFLREGGLTVQVAPSGTDLGGGQHTYGGGEALDDGVRECTTGFSVNLAGGGTGILTAAHCEGINQYRQEDGLTYSMPFVDEHIGNHGDLELHTSTHVEYDDFYSDFGVLRDVSGIKEINTSNQGDFVCVFGRFGGRDCSNIYRLFVCYFPAEGRPEACGLALMEDEITESGDSGGPWYNGNEAWGVHSGRMSFNFRTRSVFTPVFWVDDEFGAFVRQ